MNVPVEKLAKEFATLWINASENDQSNYDWVLSQLREEQPIRAAAIAAKMIAFLGIIESEGFIRRLEYLGNVVPPLPKRVVGRRIVEESDENR